MSNYEHAINIIKNWERAEQKYVKNGAIWWDKPNCGSPNPHSISSLNDPDQFRLKPEPTYVPLTRDDMPVAFVVRLSGENSDIHYVPLYVDDSGFGIAMSKSGSMTYFFSGIFGNPNIEYSADRKVWHKFRKEAK